MKIVLDMNLSPKRNVLLTNAGFESVHWSSLGASDTPDADIASYAAANDSVVITNDLDFGMILVDRNTSMPSIIQLRLDDVRPTAAGQLVLAALLRYADDLAKGAFLTVEDRRTRIRPSPFRIAN
jgi:predicted nuclease of predicted toxin-antitoxin system